VFSILTGKLVNRSIPHISLHHVTRFEPITAAHFDQRYNNFTCSLNKNVWVCTRKYFFPKIWGVKISCLTPQVNFRGSSDPPERLVPAPLKSHDVTATRMKISGEFPVQGVFRTNASDLGTPFKTCGFCC